VLSRHATDIVFCFARISIGQHAIVQEGSYALSDIAPISLIAKYDYALVRRRISGGQYKSIGSIRKSASDEINYAHLGIGSAQNLLSKQLEKPQD